MKRDDSSLTEEEQAKIAREAERLLRKAGAWGVIPTPISAVLDAASLTLDAEVSLDDGFLKRLYRRGVNKMSRGADSLKRAINKVLAVLDIRDARLYIDRGEHVMRQKFVSLHDVAHFVLDWQRKTYQLVEECDFTISPEIQDLFEREANNFSTEVMFQLSSFTDEAADCAFGIDTVTDLAKRYEASIYSSMRRYVRKNDRACAVLVFNPPVELIGEGRTMELRRSEVSPRFSQIFASVQWPHVCGADHFFVQMCPARWKSRPRTCSLVDVNGEKHECMIQALNTSRQVFFLICPSAELEHRRLEIAS
jgi:hypothetical protein